MAGIRFLSRFTLAAAFCLAVPAFAGDGGDAFEFKLGGGLMAGTLRNDQGANQFYGFGAAYRRPWASGTLVVELSYDILAGQASDKMPLNARVYAPAGPSLGSSDPVTGNAYYLAVGNSIDFRKESAAGFSARVGYAAPLGFWNGLLWQGGLSLDAYKTSSEFTGTLRPMVNDAGGKPGQVLDGNGNKYYEGFAMVREGTGVVPGLYLGLRQQLGEDFAVEFNVRNFGAKHYDWRPTTYTGRPAAMDSSTHRGYVVELCLAMTL